MTTIPTKWITLTASCGPVPVEWRVVIGGVTWTLYLARA